MNPVPDAAKCERAQRFIRDCELDLARKLSSGEKRDLLADNTSWDSAGIREIVAWLERSP